MQRTKSRQREYLEGIKKYPEEGQVSAVLMPTKETQTLERKFKFLFLVKGSSHF